MIFGMTHYQICMYFLIYSFLGWCLEVAYHALKLGKIVNRGFLNGPVCPVYGFGALALYILVHYLPKSAGSGETNVLAVFFGGMILCTAVEFAAGFLLYHLFHTRWWDYSSLPLNIGGYICPLFSVLWGIACVIVVKYVHPVVQHTSDVSIPPKYGWPVMAVLYAVYLVDLIATVLTVAGMNRKLEELDRVNQSLRVVSDGLSEAIGGTTIKASESVGEARVQGALARAEWKEEVGSRVEAQRIAHAEHKAENLARIDQVKDRLETAADESRARIDGVRDGLQAAAAESRGAVEQKRAEIADRRDALILDLAGHRVFGSGRLLRAFPDMRSRDHGQLLEQIKQVLRGNEKKSGSGKS